MWGLDAADPRIAIAAMQAMNASVRNAVFAPVFFGAPIVLFATTLVLYTTSRRAAAHWFALATAVVAAFAFALTAIVHIPVNEVLALRKVPSDIEAARIIWQEYSPSWQLWNQVRAAASELGLLLVGVGISRLRPT